MAVASSLFVALRPLRSFPRSGIFAFPDRLLRIMIARAVTRAAADRAENCESPSAGMTGREMTTAVEKER